MMQDGTIVAPERNYLKALGGGSALGGCRSPRALVIALAFGLALSVYPETSRGEALVDIVVYFDKAKAARGAGLARKSRLVDVRPAKPGEVIVTTIRGEGKETQSPPAEPGDMVVRNRCPETGNEKILISAAKFTDRYEGPTGPAGADGWLPYRPRGVEMHYVVVSQNDGEFHFVAPWGERMVARPGDAIVQDVRNQRDTYRIAKAAFACTYEVLSAPGN